MATKRTKNPASLMILAAVGLGERNLLCISVEKRKPSIARCFRKCWTQKLLLELTLLTGNTLISWFKIILFPTQIYQLSLRQRVGYILVSGEKKPLLPKYLSFNFLRECKIRSIGRFTERSFRLRRLLLSSGTVWIRTGCELCVLCTEFRAPVEGRCLGWRRFELGPAVYYVYRV